MSLSKDIMALADKAMQRQSVAVATNAFDDWREAGLCRAALERRASVADELLEALKDTVEALDHIESRMGMRVNPPTLNNARAAISHAQPTDKERA